MAGQSGERLTITVCLIDTSVLCNILDVPNRAQDREQVNAAFRGYVEQRFALLLPMATVIETGNLIAREGSGGQRRETAQRFVRAIDDAIDQRAPWALAPLPDPDAMRSWLATFPDVAMQGVGLADLSIIQEYERQCALHRGRRVFIWSLDKHLSSFDRPGTFA